MSHVTLTLTLDGLESHIIANVSSTLTNSNIWFVAALSLIVDVRTDVHTDGRMYGRTDVFTGFIRSSLRRDDLKIGVAWGTRVTQGHQQCHHLIECM